MTMEARETAGLIGSDKVEGTAVYGADGNKIGSVERVMIGKVDGKVAYAVLGFGGFLGIGDDHYPLPWQTLTYNTELGGYQVPLTNDQLTERPAIREKRRLGLGRPIPHARSINEYYGVPFPGY